MDENIYLPTIAQSDNCEHIAAKPSLYSYLRSLGFDEDIIQEAEREAQNRCGNKGKRKKFYYNCLRKAYRNLDICHDPKQLATILGLTQSEANKADALFEELPEVLHYNYSSFLDSYLEQLPIIRQPDEVRVLAQKVTEASMSLQENQPQIVAAAVIQYYLKSKHLSVSKKSLEAIFLRSAPTINKVVHTIEGIISRIDES